MILMDENAKNESRTSHAYVYLYKIIAAILVSWQHFVVAGTYQASAIDHTIKSIPGGGVFFPPETHILWKLGAFFYDHWEIEFSTVGVVLFFFASGYFIPHLQEKNNQPGRMPLLFLRRLERVYPVTFVCVAIVGVTVWLSQGLCYPFRSYLETGLVSGAYTGQEETLGVIWFLSVLMLVYLIGTLVPKLSLLNLSYVYGVLYLLVVLPAALTNYPQCLIFRNIEDSAKFCGIPLMGTAAALLEKEKSLFRKVVDMVWFFLLMLGLLRLDSLLYGTIHTYTNVATYIASFMIIVVSFLVANWVKNFSKGVEILRRIDQYLFHFYLLHVGIGFTVIYYLRINGVNVYACVAAAYLTSVIVTVIAFHISKGLVQIVRSVYKCIPGVGK